MSWHDACLELARMKPANRLLQPLSRPPRERTKIGKSFFEVIRLEPQHVRARLKSKKHLNTLPTTFIKVLNITSNPNSSFMELATVIAYDPVLMANVLRVANSSHFALNVPADDLATAVVYLGTTEIRRIALAVGSFNIFVQKGAVSPYLKNVWVHSLTTALISQQLAAFCGFEFADEAYVVGLLHDIGKAFFASSYPEIYGPLLGQIARGKGDGLELEKKVFGMTHLDVAWDLCEFWKLPSKVWHVATNHHDPSTASEEEQLLSKCVAIANVFAHETLNDTPLSPEKLAKARFWLRDLLDCVPEDNKTSPDILESILVREAKELSQCDRVTSLYC
jgi:putative nucleotidyltransferase with HDIG domain